MYRVYSLGLGYLIGLVQTAFFIGHIVGKIDIREHGSGNAGTTNTVRVLGPKEGFIVFVCDILKGILGFTLCGLLFSGSGSFLSGSMGLNPGMYGGIGVILGHCFPFYLKFKGGKGVASTLGIILCIDLRVAIVVYIFGMITVALTKYISAASLVITFFLPIGLMVVRYPAENIILAFIMTGLTWFLHRANIKRLLAGNENKFTFKKQA